MGGGTPSQVQVGGTPSTDGGYPLPRRGGTPHPVQILGWGGTPYRSSIACTCYTAVGMPLAFTQDDFLVFWDNQYQNIHIMVLSPSAGPRPGFGAGQWRTMGLGTGLGVVSFRTSGK